MPNRTHGPDLEPLTLRTSDIVAVASSVSKTGSFNNVAAAAASKIEESERLREEQRMRNSEISSVFKSKRARSGKASPVVVTHELMVLQHIMLREQCVGARSRRARRTARADTRARPLAGSSTASTSS